MPSGVTTSLKHIERNQDPINAKGRTITIPNGMADIRNRDPSAIRTMPRNTKNPQKYSSKNSETTDDRNRFPGALAAVVVLVSMRRMYVKAWKRGSVEWMGRGIGGLAIGHRSLAIARSPG